MLALRGDLESAGGSVALHSRYLTAARDGPMLRLSIDTGGERFELDARIVVNAGGLHAWQVADRSAGRRSCRRGAMPKAIILC